MVLGGLADPQRPGDTAHDLAVGGIGGHPAVAVGAGLLHIAADRLEVAGAHLIAARVELGVVGVGRRVGLPGDGHERVVQARRRRQVRVEISAQRGQHVELQGLGGDSLGVGRFDPVGLLEQVLHTGPGAAEQVLQDAAGLSAVGGREVIGVLRPPVPAAGEQPVQFHQQGQVVHRGGGEEPRQPHHRVPVTGGQQTVEAVDVVGAGEPVLVERVVDHHPPGAGSVVEGLLRQRRRVADVAEHDVDLAPRSPPDQGAGHRTTQVVLPDAHPQRTMDQGAQQNLASARIVLGANTIQDRLVVHIGQLHPDHRVRGIGDTDLGDVLLRPVADHREGLTRLTAGDPGPDRTVVQRGQPRGGDVLQRRHVRGDRREQQRLGDALLTAETRRHRPRVGVELLDGHRMLVQQSGQQPSGVQVVGGLEHRPGVAVDRFPAVDDVIESITDRNQIVDGQGVTAVDQHPLHHLQGGAFALHHRRQIPQGGDQHRGERVGQPELGLARPPVLLIGVEAVAQHIPHLRGAGEIGERLIEHRPRRIAFGFE